MDNTLETLLCTATVSIESWELLHFMKTHDLNLKVKIKFMQKIMLMFFGAIGYFSVNSFQNPTGNDQIRPDHHIPTKKWLNFLESIMHPHDFCIFLTVLDFFAPEREDRVFDERAFQFQKFVKHEIMLRRLPDYPYQSYEDIVDYLPWTDFIFENPGKTFGTYVCELKKEPWYIEVRTALIATDENVPRDTYFYENTRNIPELRKLASCCLRKLKRAAKTRFSPRYPQPPLRCNVILPWTYRS